MGSRIAALIRLRPSSVPFALAALVAYSVCGKGIPILRHDWSLPITSWALGPTVANLYSPWIPTGIGFPQPYPTFYLVGFVLQPLTILNPNWFIAALVFAIVAIVGLGGLRIGESLSPRGSAHIAVATLAILNPWTYTELVAGHIFMVLAFGFTLWLAAELLRERPREPVLLVATAMLSCQLEFFTVLAIPVSLCLAWRRNHRALLVLWLAALPCLFGIATHYMDVRGTPYLLRWEQIESVPILDGLILRGYPAGYDIAFNSIAAVSWIITAMALVGYLVAIKTRTWSVIAAAAVGLTALVLATGTTWIIGPIATFAVLHIPESGVIRELYDLLALFAIGIAIGVARFGGLSRATGIASCVAAAALLAPWIANPPTKWFVPQRDVVATRLSADAQSRTALFPDLQPLTLDGRGSGYDFDLFEQRGRSLPINTFIPEYPVVSALEYARQGDFSELEALGVRFAVVRPPLASDVGSLSSSFSVKQMGTALVSQVLPNPYPILGLLPGVPAIASIARSQKGNGIFYADANRGESLNPVVAPRIATDPTKAWVDARLAFAQQPQISTSLGGAFTSESTDTIAVPPGQDLLAWTNGSIYATDGTLIAGASPQLRWFPLRANNDVLRCVGSCALVATGNPGSYPPEAPPERPTPVAFRQIEPWLALATIPPHSSNVTLRYAVAYETSWQLIGAAQSNHFRLNSALNGWTIAAEGARTVALVNISAALQLCLEMVAFIAIAALTIVSIDPRNRPRQGDSNGEPR